MAAITPPQTCDRCSARARVRAELPAGELHFCGHHAAAYGEHLRAAGARLVTPTDVAPLLPLPGRDGPRAPAVAHRPR